MCSAEDARERRSRAGAGTASAPELLARVRLPPEVLVHPKRLTIVLSACMVAMLAWPSQAAAQHHGGSHGHGGTHVVVAGGYYGGFNGGAFPPRFFTPLFL